MKKILPLIIFLLVTEIVSAEPIIEFLQTLQNTSPKNSKTLLIFYKPDCPYCINMDKTISANANFTNQLTQKYNVQVLDITSPQGRLMADKFNVHAVPTIVNFDIATGESKIIKGFASIDKLSNVLGLLSKKIVEQKKQTENKFGVCGDGVVDAGEQCDDGNVTNGDGCSATCTVQVGYTCVGNPSICSATCGDGIVAGAEQCDDGNTVNGDGCSATCTLETAPSNDECTGAINLSSVSGSISGTNINATNSAVPNATCFINTINDVWYKFTIASTQIVRVSVSGPTVTDPAVAIYSGSCGSLTQVACNDDAGGTFFPLIQISLAAGTYYVRIVTYNGGASTTGSFSLVYNLNAPNICGNGIIESSEECDDSNVINGDGCNNVCKIENAASITGVAINRDSVRANPSAMLDVKSFDKGILIPRMSSTQRTAISSPAKGLLVFDITSNTFWYHNGIFTWTEIGGTSGNAGSGLPTGTNSQTLRNNGTNWIANSTLQNDGTNVTVSNQIKIAGGTPGNGKILTSDAAGLGTWQATPSFNTSFNVATTGAQNAATATIELVDFFGGGTANFIDGSVFNLTSDKYTVPTTGLYHFDVTVSWRFINSFVGTTSFQISCYKNAASFSTISREYFSFVSNALHTQTLGLNLKLTAGDLIDVRVINNSGAVQNIFDATFSGYRVY